MSKPFPLLLAGLVLAAVPSVAAAEDPWARLPDSLAVVAKRLIDDGKCPCRCGNYLPGSSRAQACFGCSVGKAEVSRLIHTLAAGESSGNALLVLGEPVLINVFADYTDLGLRAMWRLVHRVAAENDLHRIVLRTPARTEPARWAVALVEFARTRGLFFEMQRFVINYDGPWNPKALSALAERAGLPRAAARRYLKTADVGPQIAKDRQHAAIEGIEAFPVIVINNQVVENSARSVREAIRRVLLDDSL